MSRGCPEGTPSAPRTVVELRGWPDDDPLYMRTCPECGFFEVSESPALLWLYRQCPKCDGGDVPEAA